MWPSSRYVAADGSAPRFVLHQITPDAFAVDEPFVYRPEGRDEVAVNATTLPRTDLASIPWFASWFVGRHGRHTPAALVHDCLVRRARERGDHDARAEADLVFREALDELGVPPVRSRAMWAAVTLGTRWHVGGIRRIGLLVWLVAAIAGTAGFVYGVVTLQLPVMLVATAAPLAGALLWGRQYPAGLIASYALLFVGVPAIACIVGYAVYWVVEQVVRVVRRLLGHGTLEQLPTPPPIREVFTDTGDRSARGRAASSAPRSGTAPQTG